MLRNRFQKALAGVFVIAATAMSQAAYFDNFENTNSLGTNYNQADTSNSNVMFVNTNTAPVLGTNSIKANANNTLTYKTATFGLAKGQQISTSVLVLQRTASTNSNVLVQLGFGDKATDTFNNGAGFVSIFSRLVNDNITADNTQYHLASDNKADLNAVASENATPPTVNLTGGFGGTGHNNPVWYLYTFTLSRTDTTSFVAKTNLQLVGPAGTETPGASVISYTSGTYTNAAIAALADTGKLYAGIRSNTNSGALRLDNFSVSDATAIPEPAAAGALGLSVISLGRRRKR